MNEINASKLTVSDGDTVLLTFDTIIEKEELLEFSKNLLKQYEDLGIHLKLIVIPNTMTLDQLSDEYLLSVGLQKATQTNESPFAKMLHKIKYTFFNLN